MGRIIVFKGISEYNVLNYFAESLYEELDLLYPTKCIDLKSKNIQEILANEVVNGIDLTIGFNSMSIEYLYEKRSIPHLAIFVDHPIYHYTAFNMNLDNIYISCTDEERLYFLKNKLDYDNSFILNHAVDSKITHNIYGEKIYDIVMLGSIESSKKLRILLKEKYKNNKVIMELIDYVTELAVGNSIFTLEDLLDSVIQMEKIDININITSFEYYELLTNIEKYVRCISRERAIINFSNYKIHVFGNIKSEKIKNKENIYVHEAVDNKNAIEILKNSKISLNNTKTIYNGSHERILLASACGAINLTNYTKYFKELLGSNAIYYNDCRLDEAYEEVEYILKNDKKRIDIALEANEVVMKNHTWRNRAKQIIDMLS